MEELEQLKLYRASAEAYQVEEEEVLQELKTTKQQVEYLLKKEPKATNSDYYLIYLWLRTFGKLTLSFAEWEKLCNFARYKGTFETIRRTRQKFQEKGKYLPTDPTIRAMREQRRKAMRKAIMKI